MQVNRTPAVAAVFAIGTIFYGTSLAIGVAQAQAPTPSPPATVASNDLQCSVEVFSYSAAAKSGATRGR